MIQCHDKITLQHQKHISVNKKIGKKKGTKREKERKKERKKERQKERKRERKKKELDENKTILNCTVLC